MIGQLAKKPLQAVETVVVRYGAFAESISITELKNLAKTGVFPDSFKSYTNKLSEEQRSLIVGALRAKIPINVAAMSNLLSTQIGSTILEDLATVIQREDDAGAIALRESLINGATEPNGFSLLSSIAAYPGERLEINLSQAFKVFKSLNTAFWQTQQFMSAIAPQLTSRDPELSLPFDATQPSDAEVEEMNLNLHDRKRDRKLPVDIYWSNIASVEKPVIVFSLGMCSVRQELRY